MSLISLDINTGTVGVPFVGTFTIDKQADLSYPYVLQLNTGTIPPGLTGNLKSAKTMSQDGSGIGAPTRGATIIGDTTGASGIYLFGNGAQLQYRPLNNITYILGENLSSVFDGGVLGVIDGAPVNSSVAYSSKFILEPTLIPGNLFNDTIWTISGTPTTPGVFNFSLRVFNGDLVLETGFNFTITINAPKPKKKTVKRSGGGAVAALPVEYCFHPNQFPLSIPQSVPIGGAIYYYSHTGPDGSICFRRR